MEANNVVMFNEEVVEEAEDIIKTGSGNGLMMAAGIGLTVLTSVIAYKYIIKPMWAKIKAKKEQAQMIDAEKLSLVEDD